MKLADKNAGTTKRRYHLEKKLQHQNDPLPKFYKNESKNFICING
jgi:hypothetical protein